MRDIALKLFQYFYMLMEKPLGRYFQFWSPYYRGGTMQPEKNYSCILKVAGQV